MMEEMVFSLHSKLARRLRTETYVVLKGVKWMRHFRLLPSCCSFRKRRKDLLVRDPHSETARKEV